MDISYGTGCRCDWLGVGTPEHTPSALCVSLRPDGPRESPLPDPNVTGPCQLQASFLCKPSEGQQRMDPMDMASSETSFRAYVMCCQPCYDAQADEYIRVTHGRA